MTRGEHDFVPFGIAKCEWCGHALEAGNEEPMHERCYREQEAEWRIEHEKEQRYGV